MNVICWQIVYCVNPAGEDCSPGLFYVVYRVDGDVTYGFPYRYYQKTYNSQYDELVELKTSDLRIASENQIMSEDIQQECLDCLIQEAISDSYNYSF